MTTVNPNTFNGPNQGNSEGYIPQTIIESAKVDADFNQVHVDLDNHLGAIQTIITKLDNIDPNATDDQTVDEIVAAINASSLKIDSDNLADDVITESDLDIVVEAHRIATTILKMHPETAIKSTELTYSNTPTVLITSCTNLLDEIKNIRYQIKRLSGKTNWSDTPAASLSSLYSALNTDIANLVTHAANFTLHVTACQNAALDNANSPCGSNPFATINDISGHGCGDMLKAIYDKDHDGYVDAAEALRCGCGNKTYDDIESKIASDIAVHRAISSAHHTRYTNAEAIGAINNDVDHSSTAKHYYRDLLGKPACDSLTESQVTNLQSSKLIDGTTPWESIIVEDSNGFVPPENLPIEIISTTWTETANNISTNSYFSATTKGGVIATFTGPCYIYNGFGVVTQNNGYLQYSVDGGNVWNSCLLSAAMLKGPSANGDNLLTWQCIPMYIPSGITYKIRAGSTYSGSSSIEYGAGFNIRYKNY